ncbi:MAG: DUF3077 domain-containing protein [Pseudomonas sp.]
MNKPTIKTAPDHTFHTSGYVTKKQYLFTVTPGIPLADALNSVSDLLDTIIEPIFAAGMEEQPLQGNAAWVVLHTLRSAKAVVDSLWDASVEADRAASQPDAAQPAKE